MTKQEQKIANRYAGLTDDQLKAAINEDDREISVLETKQDQRLIAAGEKLIALKARTKHGQWLPTLKTLRNGEGLHERTARRWMSYAKDPSKLEFDRAAWRDSPGTFNSTDKDTFEDDWEAFKKKAREQQQNGTYGFYTDDPRQSNFGGKPAEEVLANEVRKARNALARIKKMAPFAEHIDADDQTLDMLNQVEAMVPECTQPFQAKGLPQPITPDNIQIGVVH